MPLGESLHAHCPICGNLELKRIAADHVESPMSFLWRWLHVPAYRCEPCRHKYFSLLPQRDGRGSLREATPIRQKTANSSRVSREEKDLQAIASNR
jgi:hypothetical protein